MKRRPPRSPLLARALLLAFLGSAAATASAHGFGQRFDLPLPLWLWIVGASFTVVVSFSVVIDFLPSRLLRPDYPRLDLSRLAAAGAVPARLTAGAGRALGVVALLATAWAGFFGTQTPQLNLAPTLVWVIWWVGFAFVCALITDLWKVVNPWDTLFRCAQALYDPTDERVLGFGYRFPPVLGVWVCVGVMIGFGWCEHVWSDAGAPRALAWAVVAYSAFTFAGMLLFGRAAWLRHCEGFSCAFALLAKFSPLQVVGERETASRRPATSARCLDKTPSVVARIPSTGLLDDRPVDTSMVVFIIVLLASVSFDGFSETSQWITMRDGAARAFGDATGTGADVVTTIGLLAAPVIFLGGYLLCSAFMATVARATNRGAMPHPPSAWLVARHFVPTLVPIAVAYHLAHYFSLLITAGQQLVPLLSDPLGLGWNLFGTAGFVVDPGLVGADVVWYVVVASVIVGHVLSVYLAHVVALDVFAEKRVAVRAEVPMLGLMVAYTMVSLWILSQPIY